MDISAEKLRMLRQQQGITQELLAKKSGLSLRTIQRLERDGGGSPETLLALSATLNVTPAQLRKDHSLPITSWSYNHTLQKLIAILILLILILGLVFIAAQGKYQLYVDIVSAAFLLLFIFCMTVLTAGFSGLKLTLAGLTALLGNYNNDANRYDHLIKLYRLQYQFCYSGALLCTLFGFVSVFYYSAHFNDDIPQTILNALSVLSLSWLYAAIVAEIIIKPLIFKLDKLTSNQM